MDISYIFTNKRLKKIFDNKKNKVLTKNFHEKNPKFNCTKINKKANFNCLRNKNENQKSPKFTFTTTADNFYRKRFNLTSLLDDEIKPRRTEKLFSAKTNKDKKFQKNDSDYFNMEEIINKRSYFQESNKKIKVNSFLEKNNSYIDNYITHSKKKLSSEELSKETSFNINKKNKAKIRESMTPFLRLKKMALLKNNLKLQKLKDIKRMQENLLILNDNRNYASEQNYKKIMNKPIKNNLLYNKLRKIDSKENRILVKKGKKIELSLLAKALLIENENSSKMKNKEISTQKNNNSDNFFIQKYSLTEANIKNLYLKTQLTGITVNHFYKSNKSNL